MAEIKEVSRCAICGAIYDRDNLPLRCCRPYEDCYECDYCGDLLSGLEMQNHLINGRCPKEIENEQGN